MFLPIHYLYALRSTHGIGPKLIRDLLQQFENNLPEIWEYISKHQSFKTKLSNELLYRAEQVITSLPYHATSLIDDHYPNLLKEIPDAPSILFYKGIMPKEPGIAVVGSRKMTSYGISTINYLLKPFCEQKIPIVSGLAYGIDTESHRLALFHESPTIAVLGSSLDKIRPIHHELLAQEIVDTQGALISEFLPNSDAQKGTFPRRNRIIAGMCPITLVVEAAEQSGALITARHALDYNREVCTIPGSIFSKVSKGCHDLLNQGATLIQSPEQLLELYHRCRQKNEQIQKLSDQECEILALISENPTPLDELAEGYPEQSAELFSHLTKLELKQLIIHIPGRGYKLRNT